MTRRANSSAGADNWRHKARPSGHGRQHVAFRSHTQTDPGWRPSRVDAPLGSNAGIANGHVGAHLNGTTYRTTALANSASVPSLEVFMMLLYLGVDQFAPDRLQRATVPS